MSEEYENIIHISIDGEAMMRERIRKMSDEELDSFLNKLISTAYIDGLVDGYEEGYQEGYNKAEEDCW